VAQLVLVQVGYLGIQTQIAAFSVIPIQIPEGCLVMLILIKELQAAFSGALQMHNGLLPPQQEHLAAYLEVINKVVAY